MSRFRGAHYLLGIALLFGVFGGLFGGQAALAAEDNYRLLLEPFGPAYLEAVALRLAQMMAYLQPIFDKAKV